MEKLNPENPIEKAILAEMTYLKDNNLLSNMGQGFYLKEDPTLFWDFMKDNSLFLYEIEDRGGYHLDLRDCPYGL